MCLGLALLAWLLWPDPRTPGTARTTDAGSDGVRGDLLESDGQGADGATIAPTLEATAGLASDRARADLPPGMPPISLHGVVVDERGRPVEGARVTGHGAADLATEATTNAEGRYELAWGSVLRGTTILVRAATADGRVGQATTWVWPTVTGPWDVPRIGLGAAGSMRVRVTRQGAAVPDARVRVLWFLKGQQHGDLATVATARTDARGEALLAGLVRTAYVVDAWDAQGRRGKADIALTTEDVPLTEVELVEGRTVSVRVIDGKTKEPIPGVVLELQERALTGYVRFDPPGGIPPTDAAGRVLLRDIAAVKSLVMVARVAGYSTVSRRAPFLANQPQEVVLALDPLPAKQWKIMPGERPVPSSGCRVQLTALELEARARYGVLEARVEDAMLVARTSLHGVDAAIAEAPDGSVALALWNEDEVVFGPPRTITARVATQEGIPLEGVLVTLRIHGEYPAAVSSDGAGWVRFEGLPAAEWHLQSVNGRLPSFDADTREGDAHVDIVFGALRWIELQVLLGDEPGLPPGLTVDQGGHLMEQHQDPERGIVELRTAARPRTEGDPSSIADLRVSAPGYAADPVELVDTTDRVHCRVVLWTQHEQVVFVRGRRVELRLQRWDGSTQRWRTLPAAGKYEVQAVIGWKTVRFVGLTEARYRALEPNTGAVSAEFEIHDGMQPPPVQFDLSTMGNVTVRLHAPDGIDLRGVLVTCALEGHTRSDWHPGVIWGRAELSIRVPGDRRVTLTARSTLLRPDPTRGTATVTRAGGEVDLWLVTGPQLRVRLPELLDESSVHIWALRDGAGSFETPKVQMVKGTYAGSLLLPGGYDVWVHVDGAVPVHVGRKEVGDGPLDLGLVDPPDGARVVVTVGEDYRGEGVVARHLGTLPYEVAGKVDDEGRATLGGLGPGRFEVWIQGREDRKRTIEIRGAETVELDLR